MALPLPCGPASGISCTLSQYTRPRSVKNKQVGVGGGDEEVVDEVLVPRLHAHPAPAAAALGAVARDRGALDVAGVGDGDRHVLVGDHVLDRDLVHRVDDLGAPRVGVVLRGSSASSSFTIWSMRADRARMSLRSAMVVVSSLRLVHDLLALEAGEALELHLQDGVGLDEGEGEALEQAGARLRRALARADELDHLVQVIEGDHAALPGCGPGPRPSGARRPSAGAPPPAGTPGSARRPRAGSGPSGAGPRRWRGR